MPWTGKAIKALTPSIAAMGRYDLTHWCRNKAKPGDIAYWHDKISDQHYYYIYNEKDQNPMWKLWLKDTIDEYIKEINKLTVEEPKMTKRCDNCNYFKEMARHTWCDHEKHKGMIVADFTSCPEYETKKAGPFDNIKFFLKDSITGEMALKYICEDCGKVMDTPFHWWMKVPYGNAVPDDVGFHFRCEECEKKKEVR